MREYSEANTTNQLLDYLGQDCEWAAECVRARYNLLKRERVELEAAQRWIPVDERLPDEGVPVLVVGQPWPEQVRTALIAFDEGWHWEVMTSCYALTDPASYEWDDDYEFTHWMPLPPPPPEAGE